MSSMTSTPLRLRLLEPSCGAITGGTRVLIHGKGFKPQPHSLLVRVRIPGSAARVEFTGRFVSDAQLECVIPSLAEDGKRVLSEFTNLAASSATVGSSPHVVPLEIQVILDSDYLSNTLLFKLHQPLSVHKITPQYVLMAPPTNITITLNLLKLPPRRLPPGGSSTGKDQPAPLVLEEIDSLPVFVRVRQASERTGAISEQIRQGRWKVSVVGVYEVEVDAVVMTFGNAMVDVSLNKSEFFRASEKNLDARQYVVYRDVHLESIEPSCISVTNGRMTEVRIFGQGFVDSGDLVVSLSQKTPVIEGKDAAAAAHGHVLQLVARLNAIYCNPGEIRCSVPANMSFGLTTFHVSLNGGRQYGRAQVVALLHRDRSILSVFPEYASLEGNSQLTIRHACLTVEDMDSPRLLQNLIPPKKVRVRFQVLDEDGAPSDRLVKIVNAEFNSAASSSPAADEQGVIRCRSPSFLDEIKQMITTDDAAGKKLAMPSHPSYVKQFRVSISLGGEPFTGALTFGYYFPPIIRSISHHHGPVTGGTSVCLRMKYKVPLHQPLIVRFQSLVSDASISVPGHVVMDTSDSEASLDRGLDSARTPRTIEHRPAYQIVCQSPEWTHSAAGPKRHNPMLTKIQVSFNGGYEFVPEEDATISPRVRKTQDQQPMGPLGLVKDLSYLYFLYYEPPVVQTVLPMSADIQGGSYLRIMGENIVDHGAPISVIFQSPELSRKVVGFVENGQIRCCAPPFHVGVVTIFVSLNSEQYTKCEFFEPETNKPILFVFYSSPSLDRISPMCASVHHSSTMQIFGVNLIETGRIKVRFSFLNAQGKMLVHKDTHGKARDGVITTSSPLFGAEYADLTAVVDVALNGNDFTAMTLGVHYFSAYTIKRIEPHTGAFQIPIDVTINVAPLITSDCVLVQVRFQTKYAQRERVFGPIQVTHWDSKQVSFTMPAISEYIDNLDALDNAFIDLSFDRSYFHNVGRLQDHYLVYNIPSLLSITPLYGAFDQETELVAVGTNLREVDTVKISYFFKADDKKAAKLMTRGKQRPVAVAVGSVNAKRQRLTWKCPSLAQLGVAPKPRDQLDGMLLQEQLRMEISVIDGQRKEVPFVFHFYQSPILLDYNPRVGYICSGSLVSFEFLEPIETPTVDFRFGNSEMMSGRVRNGRFVECFSPELAEGIHELTLSFNEQHFEHIYVVDEMDSDSPAKGTILDASTEADEGSGSFSVRSSRKARKVKKRATFQAFPLPVFTIPDNHGRIAGFGPVSGGTMVLIKGHGFIGEARIYVRFSSRYKDGFAANKSEVIVKAKVLNPQTIQCIAPPSQRLGCVGLYVSYNLQQFTDSTCYFEYHAKTVFTSKGILCGPVSGKTPVVVFVTKDDMLPHDLGLVSCTMRFEGANKLRKDVKEAAFDPETMTITAYAPMWPSNELVSIQIMLSASPYDEFVDTRIKFLFYDPPEGVIRIEPAAGPIAGGTEVLAWCGKIVDTGEITVCMSIAKPSSSSSDDEDSEEPSMQTILIKGKIAGEAVSFISPAVDCAGTAYLNISLNGINYTSVQSKSSLLYTYYVDPVIRRITPIWSSMDSSSMMTIYGDHIKDYGCRLLVRFQPQCSEGSDEILPPILVDGAFNYDLASSEYGDCVVQCEFRAAYASYYEIEISLNGQQFSNSRYMSAKYGNYSGTACTALLPLRIFSSPFFLATSTGPAAGGSTLVLFLGKKLDKMLARESKCQVQFTPIRPSDVLANIQNSGPRSMSKAAAQGGLDPVCMLGDIDHVNGKITCKAPLLRVACAASVDIMLPLLPETKTAGTSTCAFFNVKDREKYYSYESPAITEIAPSCGPTAGGTCIVIESPNIVDTGQIFVRFRSSANEREFVMIPASFSRSFPDGSISCSPLLICRAPMVEFLERPTTCEAAASTSNSTAAPALPPQGLTPRNRETLVGKNRTQTYQQMAEQSLKYKRGCTCVLKVTRNALKNAPRNNLEAALGVNVLVDFTLNAGEQFIAHSVTFHYYSDIYPEEVKWFPQHLPTRTLDRLPTETRILTLQLPKSFRLTDGTERMSLYFQGMPQPILWKRRGSSIVLHETDAAKELIVIDAPKFKTQSTMRRRSTYFRNSSVSASSSNLLSPSSSNGILPTSVKARPPPTGRRGAANIELTKQESRKSIGSVPAAQTLSTSPYIAAKVIRGNELTCPVPDFSCPGDIQVFFSPNAQQFVCLGTLRVHNPLTIKEDNKFRYCSNIGGDRFVLYCSPSSVFRYLPSRDVINEQELDQQLHSVGVVKQSQALTVAAAKDNDEDAALVDKQEMTFLNRQRHESESAIEQSVLNNWRDREFHAFQVILYPPHPRLIKKVVLSANRLDSRAQIGSNSPDELGICMFEITDWDHEVLLTTSLPVGSGYSSYSGVLSKNLMMKQSNGSTAMKTHILLVQLPTKPTIEVTMFCSRPSHSISVCGIGGLDVSQCYSSNNTATILNGMIGSVSIDPSAVSALNKPVFVCVNPSQQSQLRPEGDNFETPTDQSVIQVLVVDMSGVQVYLRGDSLPLKPWAVAHVSVQDELAQITAIDELLDSTSDLSSELVQSYQVQAVKAERRVSTIASLERIDRLARYQHTISVSICFSCADTSRNLTSTAQSRLILPGSSDLESFLGATIWSQEVQLECVMPPLAFNGPTVLIVSIDDVAFSNAICINCYDPRTWFITRLDPPCGLVQSTPAVRMQGKNFVENRKIVVRFSSATRYVNVDASVERMHLLILRIAALKNLRALMQPFLAIHSLSQAKKDEDKSISNSGSAAVATALANTTTSTPSSAPPVNFTLTVRIQSGDQSVAATCRECVVLASLAASTAPSWEEQFELPVVSKKCRLMVTVEVCEVSSSVPIELARAIVRLESLQEGVLAKRSCVLEEHFHRGQSVTTAPSWSSELDLFLHLSPLMANADFVVCNPRVLRTPQKLKVQISSGDSFFSACDEVSTLSSLAKVNPGAHWFKVYEMPTVTSTTPKVLPRSSGGEIFIHGTGFFDCDGGTIRVRLFACTKHAFTQAEELIVLERINSITTLEPRNEDFFMHDVEAAFVSNTILRCVIPAHVATYNLYYRVSFDDKEFTQAHADSRLFLFSVDSIEPKGGPVSGNTYVALSGTNIQTCMATYALVPSVKLIWMRGARELESIVVPGEFYPREDIVYFYTPQSKFGLQNISVSVELSLTVKVADSGVASSVLNSDMLALTGTVSPLSEMLGLAALPRFSHDEIPFVMYKTPTVKAIYPTTALLCGISTVELLVQGHDEKSTWGMKQAHRLRFKRRGQMQLSDVQLAGEGKMTSIVPRFTISNAFATEIPWSQRQTASAAITSPPSVSPTKPGKIANDSRFGSMKLWMRTAGVFVTLLRARNLHSSKKNTCHPFAVLNCNKTQLKSSRKEGTFAPVWNELFDFEWKQLKESPTLRVVIENQLTVDQSELLGQVEIVFNSQEFAQGFAFRSWFPLRKRHAGGGESPTHGHHPHARNAKQQSSLVSQHSSEPFNPAPMGEIEIAVCYVPLVPEVKRMNTFHASALKTTIMSAIIKKKKAAQLQTSLPPTGDELRWKKEKILRVFRQQGASTLTVPTEVVIELALNGQDFWSHAPSKCHVVPTPIVLQTEPQYLCLTGGTQLVISGLNFVASSAIRVAFALAKPGAPLSRSSVNGQNVIVVDGRYRAATTITCTTPSFEGIATENMTANVFVAVNGWDFDSVSVPQQTIKVDLSMQPQEDLRVEHEVMAGVRKHHHPNHDSSPVSAITLNEERYVVDIKQLAHLSPSNTATPTTSALVHSVGLYLKPVIEAVRPSDGVYTSCVTITGRDFTATDVAIGKRSLKQRLSVSSCILRSCCCLFPSSVLLDDGRERRPLE